MASQIGEWVLRVLLAMILVVAGIAKAFDPETFAVEIDRFQLTPWSLSVVLAFFLPWLEIVTAIALFLRKLYLGALLSVSGLGIVFTVAVGSAWWRGLDISCGCFGALMNGQISAWHLFGALLFVGIGSALLVYNRPSRG
jgi:uncharacterized membrane protein YphA (DoxX/SURF4 family)